MDYSSHFLSVSIPTIKPSLRHVFQKLDTHASALPLRHNHKPSNPCRFKPCGRADRQMRHRLNNYQPIQGLYFRYVDVTRRRI